MTPKVEWGKNWGSKFSIGISRKKSFVIFFSRTAIIGHIDMEKSLGRVDSVLFKS